METVFCVYCQQGFDFDQGNFEAAKDEIITHEAQCEANPLVIRIKELEAELEALRNAPSS
jgi:hypothetical protein